MNITRNILYFLNKYILSNNIEFCSERFPLPLGAWDGVRYFIVALPEPSI